MATEPIDGPESAEEAEQRVTALELFFDLVFVFAITQVTGLLSADPTWAGLARGMLVLGALWWAWGGYAWLTNSINPEQVAVRLAMFAAMAALLVVSLAVPQAFGEDALLFACAYVLVRVLHAVLYHLSTRGQEDLHRAVLRLIPVMTLPSLLLVGAAFLDGIPQGLLWALALALDYLAPIVRGVDGWRVSPGHFAERHGLIVIIALGESIVAVGAGAAGVPIDAGVVAAAVLGVVVTAAIWWAYFDVVAIAAERRLRAVLGAERNRMARDSYSYLHLPMIAGIVLVALGIKKTLAHVGDPLSDIAALGLCGGVALYLLGQVAFRLRDMRTLNRQRVVAALACLALVPVAMAAPALAALAMVAAVCTVLIAYEALHFREARRRLRLAHSP